MKNKGVFLAAILTAVLCISSNLLAYSGGDGSTGNPYQIANVTDFEQLSTTPTHWNKSFILTADINMEGQVFTTAIIAADTNSISGGFQGTAFTGTFYGNGHKITDFTIDGNDYLGLFGNINTGGSVKNLGLENCAVSGDSGSLYVGGLVGYNNGSISNCYSTGTVSGYSSVGGLVGYNNGSISNCYSTGTVNGSLYVGGLVGNNSGTLTSCYATGSVSGTQRVGGLMGQNYNPAGGIISNCYATGSVSGSQYVGGLVGYNNFSISNCYATGSVSGTSYVGGLVGGGGSVSSSFWDINTSGTSDGVGNVNPDPAGVMGKTTAEMKTLATFTSAGWDFVSTWGIIQHPTYPCLRTQLSADLNYDGVVDPFDLAMFADHWLEGI